MFRPLNLKTANSFRAILMRNRREELIDIPSSYITNIVYKLNDINEMTLEVPNTMQRGALMVDNPLYNMLQGKRQIVVEFNGEWERYIIDDDISIKETKTQKVKTIKAFSFEKTLVSKTFLIADGATRQLYKPEDDNVDVSTGVLNWFEEQTNWKVNFVDFDARKELGMYNESFDIDLYANHMVANIEVGGLLWDADAEVNIGDKPLNMDVIYNGLETYDSDNMLLKRENITHSFVALPYAIKHIKANYSSDEDYRFGVTYEITYINNTKQTFKYGFANVKGLNIGVDRITLNYQTGNRLEHYITKYRFFEHCSTTWYAFLKNNVEQAFNAIIKFNTFDQTIDVYSKDTLGEARGLYLSYENFIKEINKTNKVGEIVTRLWVDSPNVSISSENPLGTQYVEDYSYYINSGAMSPELQKALKRYYELVDEKQVEWLVSKEAKSEVDQLLTKRNSELSSLNERLKVSNALLVAFIKAEDTAGQERISEEITQLEEEIATLLTTIQQLKDESSEHGDAMQAIGESIVRENAKDVYGKIFTELDLEELEDSTVEETMSNDYYTISYSLYKHALDVIKDKNKLKTEFTIAVNDFLTHIRHPQGWQYYIRLGDKIEVDDQDITDEDGYIRIHGFTYSPKEDKIANLDFANDTVVTPTVKTISDIGRKVQQTASMTDFWKNTWNDSKNANALVSDLRQNGLDLAANIVRGRGTTNMVDISEAGVFVIDAENTDNQIYLGSSLIAITNTKWRTAQTAIDSNGVIADTVIGRLILGEKIFISNKDGSFAIEGNGLTIKDELGNERIFLGIESVNGTKKARLRLSSAENPNQLVLSEDGMYQILPINTRDNFDKDHPFLCDFYLGSNVMRIDKAVLRLRLQKFRAYTRGGASKEGSTTSVSSSDGGYTSVSPTSVNGGGWSDGVSSLGGGKWSSTPTSKSGGYKAISETSTDAGKVSQGFGSENGGYSARTAVASGHLQAIAWSTGVGSNVQGGGHVHTVNISASTAVKNHTHTVTVPNHTHSTNINIGAHSHSTSITVPNHTHEVEINIPEHTHYTNINIPGHSHKTDIVIPNHKHSTVVTIPSHSHPEQYGIYEFAQNPVVDIYLDNQLVSSNVGTDKEIDITSKITSISGWHTIKVVGKTSSSNSLGLGRIELDASIACFVTY